MLYANMQSMEENSFVKRIFIDVVIIILFLFLGVSLRYFNDQGFALRGRAMLASLSDIFTTTSDESQINNNDNNGEVKSPVRLVFISEKPKVIFSAPIATQPAVIPIATQIPVSPAVLIPIATPTDLIASIEQLFVADSSGAALTMLYSGSNSLLAYARVIANTNFYYQFYLMPHLDNLSRINIASGNLNANTHEIKVSMPKIDTLSSGSYDLFFAVFKNSSSTDTPVVVRKEPISIMSPSQYPIYYAPPIYYSYSSQSTPAPIIVVNNPAPIVNPPVATSTPPTASSSVQVVNISGTPVVNNNGILVLRRGSAYALNVSVPSISPNNSTVNYTVNFSQLNGSYQMAQGQNMTMNSGIFQTNQLTWASGSAINLTGDITTQGQLIYTGNIDPGCNNPGTNGTCTPAYAFDDLNCTIYSGIQGTSPSIGQDFGTPKNIRKISLYRSGNGGSCSYGSPASFGTQSFTAQLQYSDNNISWTSTTISTALPYNYNAWQTFDIADYGAHRYWRFLETGGDYLQINEIQMMAQETPSSVINIPIGFYHGVVNITGAFGTISVPFEVQVVD